MLSHFPRFVVLARLLIGICLFAASIAGSNDSAIKELCRADRDCSGYHRCIDGVCAIPPAVLGRSDAETPTVELVGEGASRGQFFVELAREGFEQARGLSHRPSMAQSWGMLFVFPRSVRHAFTMRSMRFPLDMIFIDDGEKVVDIIEGAQPKTLTLVPSSAYRYVLEVNAGAVRAQGIRVGDTMKMTGAPRS